MSLILTAAGLLSCRTAQEKAVIPPQHYPHGRVTYQQFADSAGWKLWINTGYEINPADLEILRRELPVMTFRIYAGTWCGDSKHQVPDFFHILDEAGVPKEDAGYILLNRDRKAWKDLAGTDSIKRVPTFIVLKNGIEIGRITETPKSRLETDLVEIVTQAR